MSSSAVITYVCDNCRKYATVGGDHLGRPDGWVNPRLLGGFTTEGTDACSPECAAVLLHQHADQLAREYFPRVEVPA